MKGDYKKSLLERKKRLEKQMKKADDGLYRLELAKELEDVNLQLEMLGVHDEKH